MPKVWVGSRAIRLPLPSELGVRLSIIHTKGTHEPPSETYPPCQTPRSTRRMEHMLVIDGLCYHTTHEPAHRDSPPLSVLFLPSFPSSRSMFYTPNRQQHPQVAVVLTTYLVVHLHHRFVWPSRCLLLLLLSLCSLQTFLCITPPIRRSPPTHFFSILSYLFLSLSFHTHIHSTIFELGEDRPCSSTALTTGQSIRSFAC